MQTMNGSPKHASIVLGEQKGFCFDPVIGRVEMEPKNVLSKYQEKRSSEETRKKSGLGVALPETPPDAVEEHPQNNCYADAES